jgi:hypothetical protein
MHTSVGSLPGKHFPQAAGKRRSGSCPGLRRLRSLRPSRLQREQQLIRVDADERQPYRDWLAIQGRPMGLHAGQPRPPRRSKDGQTIFPIPPAQGPKTMLSRRFPIARNNLNQCHYLHLE